MFSCFKLIMPRYQNYHFNKKGRVDLLIIDKRASLRVLINLLVIKVSSPIRHVVRELTGLTMREINQRNNLIAMKYVFMKYIQLKIIITCMWCFDFQSDRNVMLCNECMFCHRIS